MADPQVNPNALGAPTEGFGQTVTFAFDPRGVTPALELPHSTPRGMGVQGATHSQPIDRSMAYEGPPADRTAELLMKAGAEILQPYVERQRNQKFIEGVQSVMNGESAKDVADRQPWYSKIFGDTPAVEGARAYEVSSKVNQVIANETANMDRIQNLDPAAATKHFSSLMDSQMTGDQQTDAMMTKTLMEHLPTLMKTQATAYHAYTQRKASVALGQNMDTTFASLQQQGQLYSEDKITDEDMDRLKKQAVMSILPPDGINEQNYGKTLAEKLILAGQKGQFHAINAIRESGGFAALTPEQQSDVEKSLEAEEKHFRDRYAFNFAKQIAELRSDAAHLPAGMTPEDIHQRYLQMNTAYTKLTGNPQGLFTSDEVANGLAGTLNYLKEEDAAAARHAATLADKDAKKQEKEIAAAELDAMVMRRVADGDVFKARSVKGVTEDQITNATYKAFHDPNVGSDLLRNNFIRGGYVNPQMKEEFINLVRTSEGRDSPTGEFGKAVSLYQQLAAGSGSTALAAAYFGDYAPKLDRFLRMTGGDMNNPNVQQAFVAAMDTSKTQRPDSLPTKEAAVLARAVSKRLDPMLPKWMGGLHLRDETAETVAQIAEKNIEDWRGVPGVTDEEAVSRGITGAVVSGKVELLGGFAVSRAATNNSRKLREIASDGMTVPTDKADDYFKSFMGTKRVTSSDRVNVHWTGKNAAGDDTYAFTAQANGEPARIGTFTSSEWAKYAGAATKADTSPDRAPKLWNTLPLTYGPKLTSDPNFNPYEWARKQREAAAEDRKTLNKTK